MIGMDEMIAHVDNVIIADTEEALLAAACFRQVPNLGHLLFAQRTTRTNAFMMSTAMGQDLADGEILAPALSIGASTSGLPVSKFCVKHGQLSRHFLSNSQFEPLTERLIPRAHFGGASIIMPGQLLQKTIHSVYSSSRKDSSLPRQWQKSLQKAPRYHHII